MRPARLFFLLLFVVLLATRLCHFDILWAEETLPLAAASQILAGKTLYRDIWFDKPPLLAWSYVPWGAGPGWLLRLAGSLYVLAACALAYRFAAQRWGRREGFWAAGLLAFFLIFDIPSAVVPVAADLLMLAPHMAAVYLAWRGRVFWSGTAAGIAFLVNPKGVFVLAACALWSLRSLPVLAIGFMLPCALASGWMLWQGSWNAYLEQVWRWGRVYAAGTFVQDPLRNAALRSAHWLGFHTALLIGAVRFWTAEKSPEKWRWAGWAMISLAAVAAGWRFFPRYFFQLLPVFALAGARGLVLLGRYRRVVLALLLVPLIRFGPRYGLLAADLLHGRPHDWVDTAMDRDSREAARKVPASPGNTLFVWGFRPELYVYTGLPAATPFLDSQPLTGVPADRHLTQAEPVAADPARAHRAELRRYHPSLILDGLGPYNPALAITRYQDLRPWLADYEEIGRSRATVIYRRRDTR